MSFLTMKEWMNQLKDIEKGGYLNGNFRENILLPKISMWVKIVRIVNMYAKMNLILTVSKNALAKKSNLDYGNKMGSALDGF